MGTSSGQTYGAACSPNYVYLVDRYGAGAQTVANFNSLSAGADQVVEWTGVDTLYDGMRFHYQHACTYRIPWLTPNPAGAMTIEKVVLYGPAKGVGSCRGAAPRSSARKR